MMMRSITLFAAASLLTLACSSSSGPSLDPARSNCNTACTKLHDCVDKNRSIDSCTDDCAKKSDDDTSYKDKIQTCSDCVEPKACSEVGSCTDDCLNALLSSG